ncbi:MAG TPA: HAMP domain-containing protein, partial [Candidatus Eremiobacteraceae bacterium]|nr:HAMP domain-containing protein [Candidatus Eremiobacteraceae bacterium]
MRPFRTLHGRLTLAYASALFAGLALFASVSALFLIRLSTNVVDTRLRTTASALTAIAENAGPALALSSNERLEFNKVVRQDDAILFRPDGTTVITTAVSIPTEVVAFDKLGDTEMLIRQVRTPDDVIRAAVTPVYDGTRRIGTIVVWASAASLEAFWRDTILVFVVGIPAIVALAVLMAWFLTRRGLLPLRAITELAADIEAHDLSRRLRPVSEVDELGSLSATFDRMLDRLEGAFDRQRRFTADASHELRTPL